MEATFNNNTTEGQCDILNMIFKRNEKSQPTPVSQLCQASLDLAVIGNACCSALIDKKGSIVWYCLPRFDGDPIFCNLLKTNGNDSGFFDIKMPNIAHSEQHYVGNSAVLCTKLYSKTNECLEIVDFVPRFQSHDRDYRPNMLIRILKPLQGRPRVQIRLRPTFGYGWGTPEKTRGSNHIRYVLSNSTLRLTSNAPIAYLLDEVLFDVEETIFLVLMPDESLRTPIEEMCYSNLHKTLKFWKDWTKNLTIPFEYQEEVIRASISLKLCNFEETGAIVSALTTSIPQSPLHKNSTYDYRYCWLRDAFWVTNALNQIGITNTMENYLRFLSNILTSFCEKLDHQEKLIFQQQKPLHPKLAFVNPSPSSSSSSHSPSSNKDSSGSSSTTTNKENHLNPLISSLTHISGVASTPASPSILRLRIHRKEIQGVYTVSLETRIYEREVHRLSGYRGFGPVKLGNKDCDAIQHETYGSVICALAQMFFDRRLEFPGHVCLFEKMERLGEVAVANFNKPDHGPRFCFLEDGNLNTENTDPVCQLTVHTFSAVMCWAACDRLSKVASSLNLTEKTKKWAKHASLIHQNILKLCFNQKLNSFVSHFNGHAVDAYLLTLPRLGFIDPKDPKFLSTLKLIEQKLRLYPAKEDFKTEMTSSGSTTTTSSGSLVNNDENDSSSSEVEKMVPLLVENEEKDTREAKEETKKVECSSHKKIPAIVTTLVSDGNEEKKSKENETSLEKTKESQDEFTMELPFIKCFENDSFGLIGATLEYIGVLADVGRKEEAVFYFKELLKRANSFGLFSETMNQNGELWGNFPSSNVMVGIIYIANKLSKSWTSAF